MDFDNNGEINYSEFLTGTIASVHLSEENLQHFFKYLDAYNTNTITKESLTKTFQRSGKNISEQEIEEMLREMEINPEEQIDFEKFSTLMKNIIQ